MEVWVGALIGFGGSLLLFAIREVTRYRRRLRILIRKQLHQSAGPFDLKKRPTHVNTVEREELPTADYWWLTAEGRGDRQATSCLPVLYFCIGDEVIETIGLWLIHRSYEGGEDYQLTSLPPGTDVPFYCLAVFSQQVYAWNSVDEEWTALPLNGDIRVSFSMVAVVLSSNAPSNEGVEFSLDFDPESGTLKTKKGRKRSFRGTSPSIVLTS